MFRIGAYLLYKKQSKNPKYALKTDFLTIFNDNGTAPLKHLSNTPLSHLTSFMDSLNADDLILCQPPQVI